ncbi:hypothetical protein P12x_005874 [Tundrisphaera lichenicola]|uniref:hypothetical protein n=1 Tax=Tundrisphaera lichenicola TaxID=2029860 RepID=UPI003EB97564
MRRLLGAMALTAFLAVPGTPTRADEKDLTPLLDKAIAALGGEEKLAKAANATWKGQGTLTFEENETAIKTKTTVQGLDHHRAEFEMDFNGNEVKGLTILDGDKGWRKFGDDLQDLDDDAIAAEKHRAYLQAVPTILPLKGKGFKLESAPEEKVDGKPADVIKGTGPDGKKFTLYLDKESSLPVRLSATVKGWQGEDFVQDTTFSDYKEFDGVKRATKSESKRDGNPFVKVEMSEFKVIDKPDAKAFAEPN